MDLDFGSTDVRRLPVYFLIGCGDSMAGAPIRSVEAGIRQLHHDLLKMPDAVESVYTSLITFADDARQVFLLNPLTRFSMTTLPVGGGHNLGAGLQLLLESVYSEVVTTTPDRKGDYKPLVFLLFDNQPTDHWEHQLAPLQKARKDQKVGTLVAIGLGERANLAVLREITESVLSVKEVTPDLLKSFFQWTSASVTTVSQSVANMPGEQRVTLPKPPDDISIIL